MTDKRIEDIDKELHRMQEMDYQGYSDDIRYLCGLLRQCRDRIRWKTGIPITSGVYWCEIEHKGKRFTKALIYGSYSFCPSDELDMPGDLEPGQEWLEDECEVVGTGWHEEVEQFRGEFDYVVLTYGNHRGEITRYTELPQPPQQQDKCRGCGDEAKAMIAGLCVECARDTYEDRDDSTQQAEEES